MRLSQRLAPVFPYHAVAHETWVSEIAGDVLDKFAVIVASVFFFVVIRFDRDTILMLEKRGEQCSV